MRFDEMSGAINLNDHNLTRDHRDPFPWATVTVPPFYLTTFQGRANTQAG